MRFALSTLLLAMLGVSLFFGAAAWRRQRLVDEVAKLRAAGVYGLTISNDWFWPTVSDSAVIRLTNDVNFGATDMAPQYRALRDRARALGVEKFAYEMVVMDYYQVVTVLGGRELDAMSDWGNRDYAKRFVAPRIDVQR
jgi:hypothetical protein